jgi:membrane protease YdiL (CAAX protease family)
MFTQRQNTMKKFESFSTRHPIVFGFVLILLFTLLNTLTWPITQIYPYPEGSGLGEALAKIVMTVCFIGLLWRFGWLDFAGYGHFGSKRIWLIVTPLIVYKVFLGVYVFSGAFTFPFPPLVVSIGIIFFALTTSLLEESMYRGLLLTAMRKAWGSTRQGLILSALVSGLFFASLHFFNLIIRPFPVVFFQVLSMTLIGFYYAIFAITGRSIWPVVVFHWSTNAAITLALSQIPTFEETLTHWIGYTAISLIPIVVSLWLLKPAFQRSPTADTVLSEPTFSVE